jgi:outer membrane receptor protein involved in Fe transport
LIQKKNPALAASLATLCLAGVQPALAAAGSDGAAAAADAEGSQLSEIIVTSQKRAEDIKDIPISVSAIGGAQLAEHHIADYDDITRAVPGISFQAGPGPGLDNIEIRGVSSTSGSATVGIYIDEVSVTTKNEQFDGAVQPKLFDLDRIEILRGPQGTLYGASSMGGTIRFITKQPDLNAFGAEVSSDLSDTHHGGFNNDEYGILNIPVVEGVFALRIGVDLSDESGYIDHYVPTPTGAGPGGSVLTLGTNDSTGVLGRSGVNDVRTQVFRVVGKWAPADGWTVTPAFLWQRTAAADTSIFYPDIGLYDQDKRVAEPFTDVISLPSLTVSGSLGWADLTSVTSYFQRNFKRVTDGTLYNSNIFSDDYLLPANPPANAQTYQTQTVLAFLPSPAYYDAKTEQFSQELRLSSKSASVGGIPVTWTAGIYYSEQRRVYLDDEYIPGLQANFQNIYGYSISSPQSPVSPSTYSGVTYANDLIYFGHTDPTEKQIAPFGEIGLQLTPDLNLAVGLRYVHATSTLEVNSGGFYAYGLPPGYGDNEKYSATTPKASLDYALTAQSNLYVTVAKGFRLGGPTGPDPAYQPNGPNGTAGTCDTDYQNLGITGAPKEYQSDSLWSYELGTKGRYLDNHLSINAAVYAINWTDIQQTINLPTCGFNFTTNVGDAKIYGSEFELQALVAPSLTLSLNVGTTHAYISSVGAEAQGIVAVGESILNVPQFTLTPSVDYTAPVNDSLSAFVRLDAPYTGRSRGYFDSSGLPHVFQPGYGIVNLNVGITRDRLSAGLYAKNLLNWRNIIQYPSVNSVQEGYTVRPATYGLTATYRF